MNASPNLITSGALPLKITCRLRCRNAPEGPELAVPPARMCAGWAAPQDRIIFFSEVDSAQGISIYKHSRCLCARPIAARDVVERYASCSPFTADYGAFIDALLKDDAGFHMLLELVLKRLQVRTSCSALAGKVRATWRVGRQMGRSARSEGGWVDSCMHYNMLDPQQVDFVNEAAGPPQHLTLMAGVAQLCCASGGLIPHLMPVLPAEGLRGRQPPGAWQEGPLVRPAGGRAAGAGCLCAGLGRGVAVRVVLAGCSLRRIHAWSRCNTRHHYGRGLHGC